MGMYGAMLGTPAVRVFSGLRAQLRAVMEDLCKLRVCWILLVSGVIPAATDSEPR